jgi:hypothetical protein
MQDTIGITIDSGETATETTGLHQRWKLYCNITNYRERGVRNRTTSAMEIVLQHYKPHGARGKKQDYISDGKCIATLQTTRSEG